MSELGYQCSFNLAEKACSYLQGIEMCFKTEVSFNRKRQAHFNPPLPEFFYRF